MISLSNVYKKTFALMSMILMTLMFLTGCSLRSPETQEISLSNEPGGLEIVWFAKNGNLDAPENYSGKIQFGSFEYDLIESHISNEKGAKDGLKKFRYWLDAGEIIEASNSSTTAFNEITIQIFANEIGEKSQPYLVKKFEVPKEAPSFYSYSLFDSPWVDKLSVDFSIGNAWNFPDSYTCILSGDITATTTVQLSEVLPPHDGNLPLPCNFIYSGVDGMNVSVAISATNEYGNSPIFMSEKFTLTTFVSELVPVEPECPNPLSINELDAKPGSCGTLNVEVSQADLDTGSCIFLGKWPQANGDTAFGLFRFCNVYVEGAFTEGLTYTVSAKVLGPTTYTAKIGGKRTVIEFELVK